MARGRRRRDCRGERRLAHARRPLPRRRSSPSCSTSRSAAHQTRRRCAAAGSSCGSGDGGSSLLSGGAAAAAAAAATTSSVCSRLSSGCTTACCPDCTPPSRCTSRARTPPTRIGRRRVFSLSSLTPTSLCFRYCLQPETGGECLRWGVNRSLAHSRVLAHKERLDNLYVAFAVMLRAVVKAGDAITAAVPPAGAAMGEGRREWETRLLPGTRAHGARRADGARWLAE